MRVTTEPKSLDERAAEGLEFGSFRTPVPLSARRRKLVLATYNIRYAVGPRLISGGIFRRFGFSYPGRRPRLVERNIRRAARILSDDSGNPAADIIALQEADSGTTRAGRRHVARELAQLLRMDYVRAALDKPPDEDPKSKQWYLDFEEPLQQTDEGTTGIALLSRVPLEEVRRVELPWSVCAWRPRLALSAEVPFSDKTLLLFNLHIDPHGSVEERIEQQRAVIEIASNHFNKGPVVLLGDFNTLSRRARDETRRFLEEQGFSTPIQTGTATWRAGLLRLHTDWIFVRGARVSRWGVWRRRGVSDHWPVWAEIVADDEG